MAPSQPPSAAEQLLLEMINRARLDPVAEAARFDIGLNDGLAPGTIAARPLEPLAWNPRLATAADGHAAWMLDQSDFGHEGAGGSTAGDRIAAAGYRFQGTWAWGENLSLRADGPAERIALSVHEGLMESAGHRVNILRPAFREIGLGAADGPFEQGRWTPDVALVVENFARSGARAFVTGVAYADGDGDGAYGLGEGQGGWRLDMLGDGRGGPATGAAGGYALGVAEATAGAWVTVAASRGDERLVARLDMAGGNVKLDVVDGRALAASGDLRLGEGASEGRLLGAADLDLAGNGAGNVLRGNRGDNILSGRGGGDRIEGGGGHDRLAGGRGNDALRGGAGADAFVFAPRQGSDAVLDLGRHDRVVVDVGAGLDAAAFLAARGAADGDDYVIAFEGTRVRFEGAGEALLLHALDLV